MNMRQKYIAGAAVAITVTAVVSSCTASPAKAVTQAPRSTTAAQR